MDVHRRGAAGNSTDQWLIDVAPMLSDPSFTATLGNLDLEVPATLTVPITVDSPELRPGKLRWLATWGPWASIGTAVLATVSALLMLAAARSRGKALVALGVSALLVGGAGWAGIEMAQRFVDAALNRTTGDIRTVAEVMVATAENSLHQWLNVTLLAAAGLVVLGAIAAALAGCCGALQPIHHPSHRRALDEVLVVWVAVDVPVRPDVPGMMGPPVRQRRERVRHVDRHDVSPSFQKLARIVARAAGGGLR